MVVKAGILADARYEDGLPVAQVASWNEFGTRNIPARPFMARAKAFIEGGALDRKIEQIGYSRSWGEPEEDDVGEFLRDAIKAAIISTNYAPNAPSTIAKKGHANQLIDTQLMLDSIQYEVVIEAQPASVETGGRRSFR